MTLWLYLHFPRLQLDGLVAAGDDERPLAIVDGRDHRVVQLDDSAWQAGIRLGMGLGTAAALCAGLRVVAYRTGDEERRLQEIAQTLYGVTADIALFPPDGLLLRATPMLALYRGLMPWAAAIDAALEPLAICRRRATGYTPLAARLLARSGANCLDDDPTRLHDELAQLSLTATDLSAQTTAKLARVGVRQLGDLLSLSLKEISRRFDIDLVNALGRLRGELHHPVEFFHPPPRFHRYRELPFEIERTALLLHPLRQLFGEMEQFLRQREQVASRVELTLSLRGGEACPLTLAAAQGEQQASRWQQLLELRLERLELAAPVVAVALDAGPAEPRRAQSGDLFDGQSGSLTAAQLIALLQARLGEEVVHAPALVDDHRPELAAQLAVPGSVAESTTPAAGLRPALLLPQPAPLDQPVELALGPERIATGWWDDRPVQRDYFIARNREGQWWWVFRNREGGQWFLHGYFC